MGKIIILFCSVLLVGGSAKTKNPNNYYMEMDSCYVTKVDTLQDLTKSEVELYKEILLKDKKGKNLIELAEKNGWPLIKNGGKDYLIDIRNGRPIYISTDNKKYLLKNDLNK